MNSKIRALERRIQRVKQKLVDLGELHPGSLSKQYNVCGNPTCRCKATPPQKHGPYYQLSWTRQRKSTTRLVHRGQLTTVRKSLRNYKTMRELVDQWIDAAIELCDLELKRSRDDSKASKEG